MTGCQGVIARALLFWRNIGRSGVSLKTNPAMRLASLAFALSLTTFLSTSASADGKQDRVKPELVVTTEPSEDGKTQDMRVVVRGISDYCRAIADTTVLRSSESIRIVRDRPSRVSRCMGTQDRAFLIKNVTPGRYMISYELMPYVAPARPIRVVWTNAYVE